MTSALSSSSSKLVEEHIEFARSVAASFAKCLPAHVELDELISDAYVGLVEAANSFKPGGSATFTSFAFSRIRGAILDALRNRQHTRRIVPDPVMASIDMTICDCGSEALLRNALASNAEAHEHQVVRRDFVQHIMLKLDPFSRDCVRRCWLEGKAQRLAAKELGTAQAVICETLGAARRELRSLFADEVANG